MSYLLWLIFIAILILFGGAFVWTLKCPQEDNEDNDKDLSEWTCTSCGFHVQMGTECIYCGEQKLVS